MKVNHLHLAAELARRLADGWEPITLQEIKRQLSALGYKLDRTMDCRCNAVYQSGKWAGESHPCLTTGIKEADTGMSFCNDQARRDKNFQTLQALRRELYAVVGHYILEL